MRYYVFVKSSFKHTSEECKSKRAYVFRCLIFSLSGPCELLCFFVFFCPLDLGSGDCDVVSLYVLYCSVNGSVYFVRCMFVNCLVKQFAICLHVVVILLLNAMVFVSVVGGTL